MKQKSEKYLESLKSDYPVFLNYLKAKFPLFHNSNFFFRDLHYGVKNYLEKKEMPVSYADAEEIAEKLAEFFKEQEIFVLINEKSWKLNYPEFVTTVPGDPL
jgi:hypothetical protein